MGRHYACTVGFHLIFGHLIRYVYYLEHKRFLMKEHFVVCLAMFMYALVLHVFDRSHVVRSR